MFLTPYFLRRLAMTMITTITAMMSKRISNNHSHVRVVFSVISVLTVVVIVGAVSVSPLGCVAVVEETAPAPCIVVVPLPAPPWSVVAGLPAAP